MKVILTKHAYERYCERGKPARLDYYGFQSYLCQESIEGVCYLEWKGKEVVYLHQAYWLYECDSIKKELTLITCLGILEFISLSKWSRQESRKNNRYARKFAEC